MAHEMAQEMFQANTEGNSSKSEGKLIEHYGPYGSQLRENYRLLLEENARFTEVMVWAGYVVDAIGFRWVDANGKPFKEVFGTTSGEVSLVALKDGEYITRISGKHGKYKHQNNDVVIGTITIHTNKNPGGYGPYGKAKDLSSRTI
ncbi:Mannose/glucose-specific lectin [Bienertia sinuspersici]